MDDIKRKEIIGKLEQFDTPSITNVVASYPSDKQHCLGLYAPWSCNWYTDQTLKCIFPDLGRRSGYAITVVYGDASEDFSRLTFEDLLNAIDQSKKPVVVCIKQDMLPERKNKSGLCGGNMMTAFKALGAIGVISDGPSRDVDEIRPMKMQYMLTGVAPGHGRFSINAINVPVNICGMDVMPGDMIHMDENGAVKFPEEYAETICERAKLLLDCEAKRQGLIRNTKNVKEIMSVLDGWKDE